MTPDRWERMVKNCLEKDGGLWSDNVAKLLRAQHRAVMNMVSRMKRGKPREQALWECGVGTILFSECGKSVVKCSKRLALRHSGDPRATGVALHELISAHGRVCIACRSSLILELCAF